MSSFPPGGLAIVIGSTGGIGAAFVAALEGSGDFAAVIPLSRADLDLRHEASIAGAAVHVKSLGLELRLVVIATGFLHGDGFMPEKSLAGLSAAHLTQSFAINAIGPALVMKHFLPLLPRQGKSVFAVLSAKVGSIGDNATGGWYSYRAAKAALNQLLHTAAIEIARRAPEAVLVALHPGTVDTQLSAPFAKNGLSVRPPAVAAAEMLAVLEDLTASQSGGFFDYKAAELPW